jgi:hypothetical protein
MMIAVSAERLHASNAKIPGLLIMINEAGPGTLAFFVVCSIQKHLL